jgi:hypothetical protein
VRGFVDAMRSFALRALRVVVRVPMCVRCVRSRGGERGATVVGGARMFSMSRKTALRIDDDSLERTARVPRTHRGRRGPADGRLVGEVIAIAFDRCEAVAAEGICGARPDAVCSGCGSARCHAHGAGDDDARRCSDCDATLLVLADASFDDVLDTRLRLVRVPRF